MYRPLPPLSRVSRPGSLSFARHRVSVVLRWFSTRTVTVRVFRKTFKVRPIITPPVSYHHRGPPLPLLPLRSPGFLSSGRYDTPTPRLSWTVRHPITPHPDCPGRYDTPLPDCPGRYDNRPPRLSWMVRQPVTPRLSWTVRHPTPTVLDGTTPPVTVLNGMTTPPPRLSWTVTTPYPDCPGRYENPRQLSGTVQQSPPIVLDGTTPPNPTVLDGTTLPRDCPGRYDPLDSPGRDESSPFPLFCLSPPISITTTPYFRSVLTPPPTQSRPSTFICTFPSLQDPILVLVSWSLSSHLFLGHQKIEGFILLSGLKWRLAVSDIG